MGIIAVPNPNHEGGSAVTRSFRTGGEKHADSFSVARVRPRTSKGITDLLLLTVTRLDAACPSKKSCDGRENEANRRGAPTDRPRHRIKGPDVRSELKTHDGPKAAKHPIQTPPVSRDPVTRPTDTTPWSRRTPNPNFLIKPATYLAG